MTDLIAIVDDTKNLVPQPYKGPVRVRFGLDGGRSLFFKGADDQWYSGTVQASKTEEDATLWRVQAVFKMTPYDQFLVGLEPKRTEPSVP